MTDALIAPPRPRRRRHLAIATLLAVALAAGTAAGLLQPAAADEGPEIVLKSGDRKVIVSERPMGSSGVGTNGPSDPMDCADVPEIAVSCDVYRLKIDLESSEDALNFLTLRVDFETVVVPSISAVAVALVEIGAGDLDIGVWDISGEEPALMAVAGAGEPYKIPEIAAFEPEHPEYLVTIESTRAPILGYTLTAAFSNELFETPFEALDPALQDGSQSADPAPFDDSFDRPAPAALDPIDEGFAEVTPPPAFTGSELLAPAPVVADGDFAGFRSVIDDALAPPAIDAETAAAVLPKAKAPGTAVLLFWLLVVPLLLLAFVVAVLRRRRPTALQA
jgi:hypothetical protein